MSKTVIGYVVASLSGNYLQSNMKWGGKTHRLRWKDMRIEDARALALEMAKKSGGHLVRLVRTVKPPPAAEPERHVTFNQTATDRRLRAPLTLNDVNPSLRALFRLYLLAEPDGDTGTFFSWITDELQIEEG
jgi:hypothetical protein